LRMPPALGDPRIVAIHAVDPLGRLGKDELLYAVLADLALEAVSVIAVVTGHDCLVEDRLPAHVAAVGAVGADRRAVRE
jgi:hypothetical protein